MIAAGPGEREEAGPRRGRGLRWVFAQMPGDIAGQADVALGALQATSAVARQLRANGHETWLVAECAAPVSAFHGMALVRSFGSGGGWRRALESIGRIDVLVGLSRLDVLMWGLGRKQICWNHNPSVLYGIPEHGRPLYWMAQAVVCPSEASRRQQHSWGVPAPLLRVIPNGIETSVFAEAACPAPEAARRRRLAFVGSCSPWKGFDLVLEAFAEVRREVSDLTLDVYGDAPAWPALQHPARPPLQLTPCGLDWPALEAVLPGLRYHGKKNPAELAEALRRTGYLVCASRHEETFSLAALEAQACGCLPIAPRHGAYPERVEDGITGFLYDSSSAGALAAALRRALASEDGDARFQRHAAARQAADLTWIRAATAFEQLVQKLNPVGAARRLGCLGHRALKRAVRLLSTVHEAVPQKPS